MDARETKLKLLGELICVDIKYTRAAEINFLPSNLRAIVIFGPPSSHMYSAVSKGGTDQSDHAKMMSSE